MESAIAEGAAVSLGTVRVGKEIGRGGFGVVHEAKLDGIDFEFAIKFLDPSKLNPDSATQERFVREANVLFRLRHPVIIPIFGVGRLDDRPYILMELFKGIDLHEARARQSHPDPAKVLLFIEQVADGLAHAHDQKVVHRDIKPTNLMVDPKTASARILDFGVAAVLDPMGERLTRTSARGVGDAFSAPELSEAPALIDARSDIYSLGACWFWLLTGSVPKGHNLEARLRGAARLAPAYEATLLRCLDQINARYGSARELADTLRALRLGESTALLSTPSDDEAVVLGAVAAACPTAAGSVSFYRIEQDLSGRISRLRIGVAFRALKRRGLVEEFVGQDESGSFEALRPTATGADWVERNLARIEALDEPLVMPLFPGEPVQTDDIPF